jgi:hypothetical protein
MMYDLEPGEIPWGLLKWKFRLGESVSAGPDFIIAVVKSGELRRLSSPSQIACHLLVRKERTFLPHPCIRHNRPHCKHGNCGPPIRIQTSFCSLHIQIHARSSCPPISIRVGVNPRRLWLATHLHPCISIAMSYPNGPRLAPVESQPPP